MSANSSIEWTQHTLNPWQGCVKVSPGCKHCYAEAHDKRHLYERIRHWGATAPRLFASDSYMRKPLAWNRKAAKTGQRARVFCMSMGDLFEQHALPRIAARQDAYRARLYQIIEQTPHLDWLLLSKRPENISAMLPSEWLKWPRPNVWLGTSAENQATAAERLPVLLDTPARVHFVSYKPVLGPLDLEAAAPGHCIPLELDWLIAGSESGSSARPAELEWFRSVRDQCQRLGIDFFFKQWVADGRRKSLPMLDDRQWCDVPSPDRKAPRQQRSYGDYLDAGDMYQVAQALLTEVRTLHSRLAEFQGRTQPCHWMLATDAKGIIYANPIGHPALGEALRILAHQRAELLDQLAAHEHKAVAALEKDSV